MPTELPSGLDVYSILLSAMDNPEYRAKLLYIVGAIFGFGFIVGMFVCAIFSNPANEQRKGDK